MARVQVTFEELKHRMGILNARFHNHDRGGRIQFCFTQIGSRLRLHLAEDGQEGKGLSPRLSRGEMDRWLGGFEEAVDLLFYNPDAR